MSEPDESLRYDKHVFLCTNLRADGNKSCGMAGAAQLLGYTKRLVSGAGPTPGIRISSSGCLGRCNHGPVLVIYPDNLWFAYQTEKQIADILRIHVLHEAAVQGEG